MGGVSQETMALTEIDGRRCLRLTGDVRLENNGGFIQMALDLAIEGQPLDASSCAGVLLVARGNGESYGVHLRTPDCLRPWQSYRAGFVAAPEWREIRLPFQRFEPSADGVARRPTPAPDRPRRHRPRLPCRSRRQRGRSLLLIPTTRDAASAAVRSRSRELAGRVTFHNEDSGFCVLRVKTRGRRDLVTVVGHAASISAGRERTWVNGRTHGVWARSAPRSANR